MGLGPAKDLAHMFARHARGYCPVCGKSMEFAKFRDDLSKREASITGFCQECQDKTFGVQATKQPVFQREYLCHFQEEEPDDGERGSTEENPMQVKVDFAGCDMEDVVEWKTKNRRR